jgi:hypothetical protein
MDNYNEVGMGVQANTLVSIFTTVIASLADVILGTP